MAKKHYKNYSIRKRDSRYQIRITYKGTTYSHSFNPPEGLSESKAYSAAEKEAIRLRDKILLGYGSSMPTFAAFAETLIATKRANNLKKSTLSNYEDLLPRLIEFFGDTPLDCITPQRINQFYIFLQNSTKRIDDSAITKDESFAVLIKKRQITQKALSISSGVSINTIADTIHGKRVSKTTAEKLCGALEIDLETYFNIISNKAPISSRTIKHHSTLLHTIMDEAVRQRIIDFNPVKSTTPPRAQRKQVNYYQPEEVAEILDKLSDEPLRWRVLITLLINTGCRRAEIAGLRWSEILWDDNLLHINHEVLYNEKDGLYTEDSIKNTDEKYVQVDSGTMQLLRQYYDDFLSDMKKLSHLSKKDYPEYLFYQYKDPSKPIHPSSINRFLKKFSEKNGFKNINPHSLRHSLASALIADGVDTYAISRQLGHKQVSTTQNIYAHQIKEHQAKIAERIPYVYRKQPPK